MHRNLYLGLGVVGLALVGILVARLTGGGVEAPEVPLPDSMAAIGDSITQAVAVNSGAFGASAGHSWATGNDETDDIASHYERLAEAHPVITGKVFNNSVPGAKMVDALAQVQITVSQRPDYVLFLMGGNDICTTSADTMTTAADFENQFKTAMDQLARGLPQSSIYVVSIPDIYHLWEIGHENLVTATIWANGGVCQAMLSDNEADREEGRDRNVQFNEILERVCTTYANCLFDGGAVFDHKFSEEEIGPLDHFHPSEQGQAALAEISWTNGYWADL